jgi:hypothetical protein
MSKNVEIFHENLNIVEDNRQSIKVENPFLESSLQDIIEEENRQSKYLRENIFQESPFIENNDEKNIENNEKNQKEKKELSIKELLKDDVTVETTPLSQVFDSF